MSVLTFTKRTIESIPAPAKRHVTHRDANTNGLWIKIERSGRKTFVWSRRLNAKRLAYRTLGEYPGVGIETAREAANECNGILAKWRREGCPGVDPFARPEGLTLEEAVEAYIAQHLLQHAKRPEKAEKLFRWGMEKYAADLLPKRLMDIRREDVTALHRKLGARHQRTANAVVKQIRTLFNFCRKEQLHSAENPARDIKFFHEVKRDRFIQPDELSKLWRALRASENEDLKDFTNLALFTRARKSDILSMRWADVSLERKVWVIPDPKSRVPYAVPLDDEVIEILKVRLERQQVVSPWVFPSAASASGHVQDVKKAFHKLLDDAGLEHPAGHALRIRMHDLRRTAPSYAAAQGTSLQIIGKSLGHASTDATQVYARLNLEPVREAMSEANAAIRKLMKKKPKVKRAALPAAPKESAHAAGN